MGIFPRSPKESSADPVAAEADRQPGTVRRRSWRSRRPRRPRRALRRVVIVVLAVLGLVLVSTAVNLLLERHERATIAPYGERVDIAGGAVNVYRSGGTGPPMVLLSGLGTAAPALDFAPLIRELPDFSVIVVEGFGYGYSDLTASERTNQNISTELHEVLTKLNIPRPYVLTGHSIAGFYMLDYANRYPSEVSAVIGIDPTVPKATEGPVELPLQGPGWLRMLSVTGVARAVVAVAPGLAEPDGNAYTADERERIRLMTSWNLGNQAVEDETARIGNNASALRGVRYPDGLPVLAFVSGAGESEEPAKAATLEELLKNVQRHEIVPLAGGHYLHWTQARPMAEKIREFLGRH
jgi:pimeloyl-ACP methyl ester carboxylesterase